MDYTILVNKYHKIDEQTMEKIKKVYVKNILNEEVLIEKKTLLCFNKLKEFLLTKGITIDIESSYRTIKDQLDIIDFYLQEKGKDYVKKYVAPLYCSEHHTGLAIDFSVKKENHYITKIDEIWENIDLYLEIPKYLKDFGFILRYPKGKEKLTGFNYEPWHIRYVGKEVATYLTENNLTLEEYYQKINSGIILINKKENMTSRDVVNIVSKTLGIKKVGHTGTLDPLAKGLLVITVGNATKIGEILTSKDKEYIASFKLGILTDTLDITGKVIKKEKVPKDIDINKALKKFKTTYNQEVPIYSAVKVNGKKLYEYARENKKIILPKKEVTIKEIELLEEKDGIYKIKCLVSKGTYIRSLIRDIGIYLNTYATMTDLIRTTQSNFKLKDSYDLEDIKNNNFKIIKIKDALNIKTITIKDKLLFKIKNGVVLNNLNESEDKILFVDENDFEIAIYQKKDNLYKPWKVFL